MKPWGWIGDDIESLYNRRNLSVALDTETTGLTYADEVLGVSLAWRDNQGSMQSAYLFNPVGQLSFDLDGAVEGELDIAPFLARIADSHEVAFFNEAFDTRAIHRVSPTARPTWTHDVAHMSALLGPLEERSLEWLYRRTFGTTEREVEWARMKKFRSRMETVPLNTQAKYARKDAIATLELFERLMPSIRREFDETFYNRDRKYALAVMDMIRNGLRLDFSFCHDTEHQFREQMIEIEKELRDRGLRDIGSNPSVAAFLFRTLNLPILGPTTRVTNSTFPHGVPSVAADVLEQLAEFDESAKLIVTWRQLAKSISEWLGKYREHASIDGRIHSLLDPFGTVSSRISASEPNVTAIAMEDRGTAFGSMLGLLVGDEGEELWALDYSQAEVRLAASVAKEPTLIEAFHSGEDPYRNMAQRIYGDRSRRNDAKRATLASIYEVGPAKFSETYGVPIGEAEIILRTFRQATPRLRTASSLCQMEVKQHGRILSYAGRPRWFGNWEIDQAYKAFNQKIQMGVAEMIRDAINEVCDIFPGRVRLQVHDSIIVSVPKRASARREMLHEIETIMESSVPQEFSDLIPFEAQPKRWQLKKGRSKKR